MGIPYRKDINLQVPYFAWQHLPGNICLTQSRKCHSSFAEQFTSFDPFPSLLLQD